MPTSHPPPARELRIGPGAVRAAAPAGAVADVLLGAAVSPALQVAALVALILAAVTVEGRRGAGVPVPAGHAHS